MANGHLINVFSAIDLLHIMENIGHDSFYLSDYNEKFCETLKGGTLNGLRKWGLVEKTGNERVSRYTFKDYHYTWGREVEVEVTIPSKTFEWHVSDKAWQLHQELIAYVEACKCLNRGL